MPTEFQEGPAARLNALLRGEISAVETYDQAIAKAADERPLDAATLRRIAQEHGRAAQKLRAAVVRAGGRPENSSGVWGAYAKAAGAAPSPPLRGEGIL